MPNLNSQISCYSGLLFFLIPKFYFFKRFSTKIHHSFPLANIYINIYLTFILFQCEIQNIQLILLTLVRLFNIPKFLIKIPTKYSVWFFVFLLECLQFVTDSNRSKFKLFCLSLPMRTIPTDTTFYPLKYPQNIQNWKYFFWPIKDHYNFKLFLTFLIKKIKQDLRFFILVVFVSFYVI